MLIAASITPVLAPLVAQIEAHRQTVERQGDTIREQAKTIGELRATVATLEARTAAQTVEVLQSHLSWGAGCGRAGGR
jgi:DNA-binding GntR family transcriptional regulator